MCYDLDDNRS